MSNAWGNGSRDLPTQRPVTLAKTANNEVDVVRGQRGQQVSMVNQQGQYMGPTKLRSLYNTLSRPYRTKLSKSLPHNTERRTSIIA